MRHIANVMEYMPVVQILDVPVPQMVDSVPVTDRILQHNMDQIGGYGVEQLVVVPKLSTQTRISAPAFVPEPQTAEQLVNVPVLSFDDCFLVLQVVLSFPFFLLLPCVSFIFSCSQFVLYFLFVKNVFLLFFRFSFSKLLPLLATESRFYKICFLRSRCSMEMWCLDDTGQDSWNWVGPPAWERA